MLRITENHINSTKGYRLGDSASYEPYTDNIGRLFRDFQKEYGRCVSKVYQDTPDGIPDEIGWVFQKKREYEDADRCRLRGEERYYIHEVWVTIGQVL